MCAQVRSGCARRKRHVGAMGNCFSAKADPDSGEPFQAYVWKVHPGAVCPRFVLPVLCPPCWALLAVVLFLAC